MLQWTLAIAKGQQWNSLTWKFHDYNSKIKNPRFMHQKERITALYFFTTWVVIVITKKRRAGVEQQWHVITSGQ